MIFRLLILVALVLFSCKKGLNKKDKQDVEKVLSSDKITEKVEGHKYYIEVKDSGLKTIFGRKMGASVSSLILYEHIYNTSTSLSYNSSFGVLFSNDGMRIEFNLNEISIIKEGKDRIDKTITAFINNSLQDSNQFYLKKYDHSNIQWNNVVSYDIMGFEKSETNINNQKTESILFRYILLPKLTEVWFYYSPDQNKIIFIINPRNKNSDYTLE